MKVVTLVTVVAVVMRKKNVIKQILWVNFAYWWSCFRGEPAQQAFFPQSACQYILIDLWHFPIHSPDRKCVLGWRWEQNICLATGELGPTEYLVLKEKGRKGAGACLQ